MKLESFFVDGKAIKVQCSFKEDFVVHVLETVIISHKDIGAAAVGNNNSLSIVNVGSKDSDFRDMRFCGDRGNRGKRILVNFHEYKMRRVWLLMC